MKGTVFLKPLEYNIEALGEKWRQGDKIKGTLKVKNHGPDKMVLPFLKVSLSSGNYKKIKAKDKKTWEIVFEKTLGESITVDASCEVEFSFEFTLPEDCRTTDKDGSLYLVFVDNVNKADSWPAGHIELIILPKLVLEQILQILENFIRFKISQTKYSKGMVEVKLSPPTSRELSHVDSLILRIKEVDKTLNIEYLFNLRVLDMAGGTMTAEKKTKQFEQNFSSKQYTIYGDSINQDFIIESINSILKDVKPKLLM
ncbi:MAG: hypothetical protein WC635_11820 [Bacteriovorax sp.]|jgi:hypothetical protein